MNEDSNSDYEPPKKKSKTNLFLDESLASTADRNGFSDRQLARLLPQVPALRDMMKNGEFSCSRSAIRNGRMKSRKTITTRIKKNFVTQEPLTVHWDGKLMEGFEKNCKVNRLVTIVTGNGMEKILEISKCQSGKGEEEAEAVCAALEKWDLTDRVKAMCFDTTASNTGPYKGACILIEDKLGRKLIHLACRHHVLELIPTAIYEKLYCAPNGPDPQLFKRFLNAWSTIDKSKFNSGMEDEEMEPFLKTIQDSTISFCKEQLKIFQPRDDYKQMLELALLVMGEEQTKVSFLT